MKIIAIFSLLVLVAAASGCSASGAFASAGPSIGSAAQTSLSRPSTSADLIYASGPSNTYILSYPDGTVLNSIAVGQANGICSDAHGDVFIPGDEEVLKFSHGGTTPIATLEDDNFEPSSCASDVSSGNLAVANARTVSNQSGNVAIYENGKGNPKFVSSPSIETYEFCTYDNSGNLFVTGKSSSENFILAELPNGSSSFTVLKLNTALAAPGVIQWDGTDLTLGTNVNTKLYRVQVAGSSATVVGTLKLSNVAHSSFSFFIFGNRVLAPTGRYGRNLGFWRYPRGGKKLKGVGPLYPTHARIGGITVSQ